MDLCANSEVTELGDWQQCSVELMEAGLLPEGWCNTTETYVQSTQHVQHTYALGSWSAEVIQKTWSNWTWVQTKSHLEEKTESAVVFYCVWMCICIEGCVLVTWMHLCSEIHLFVCRSLGVTLSTICAQFDCWFCKCNNQNQDKSYQTSFWSWKLFLDRII